MTTVYVNGERREVGAGATVANVVAALGEGPRRGIAVAVDAEVVPHPQWERFELADGARVEVLRAIQGG